MQGSSWKDIPVVVMSSENVPSRISMYVSHSFSYYFFSRIKRVLYLRLFKTFSIDYDTNIYEKSMIDLTGACKKGQKNSFSSLFSYQT